MYKTVHLYTLTTTDWLKTILTEGMILDHDVVTVDGLVGLIDPAPDDVGR